MALNSAFNEMLKLKPQVNNSMKMLLELAAEISEHRGESDFTNEENALKTLMQESIALDCDIVAFNSAADCYTRTVDGGTVEMRSAKFNEILENQVPQRTNVHSNMYAELCHTLERERVLSQGLDADLAVSSHQPTFKDPITQQPIKDPVRHRICNHIYDKDSIENYIQTTRRPRCPYGGCKNAGLLKKDDLIHDAHTARIIRAGATDSINE